MLVLRRKKNERITIRVEPSPEPQTITMTLVDIDRKAAILGFDAGHRVVILRSELRDRGEVRQ